MKKIYMVTALLLTVAARAQMPPGAIGYWPFNGNANDLSGNGNNGIVSGATLAHDRFGNANSAYKFNGLGDKIIVTNNASIDMGPGDDFTIAIWEKAYTNTSDHLIMSKHVGGGSQNGYMFMINIHDMGYCTTPNHISLYTACGYLQDACSDNDILKDSTWHFLLGTYVASTNVSSFYVDGILQADAGARAGSIGNPGNLSFGNDDYANAGFFNGVLDEGMIYKRVLTPPEILQLYHMTYTVGIHENNAMPGVFISPNPNNGIFTVNGLKDNTSLEIINCIGSLVLTQTLEKEKPTVDLGNYASGIYYVKLKGAGNQKMFKVIKN